MFLCSISNLDTSDHLWFDLIHFHLLGQMSCTWISVFYFVDICWVFDFFYWSIFRWRNDWHWEGVCRTTQDQTAERCKWFWVVNDSMLHYVLSPIDIRVHSGPLKPLKCFILGKNIKGPLKSFKNKFGPLKFQKVL